MSVQSNTHLKTLGNVAWLEITRPEALNALNAAVLTELGVHVAALQLRTDISVVVLSGSGDKAFVAGADIKEMQNLTSVQAQSFSRLGSQVFAALENLPQVVIASVQGFALGGGLELAMATDFIVASQKARFGLPEVSLGLIPGFGGTQRLARRIGAAKALQWLVTADKYSADEAAAAGLVNHVVPHEELSAFVQNLVTRISKNGPDAVRAAKFVLREGLAGTLKSGCELESSYFGLRFKTAEATEGLSAFVDKRPPQFPRELEKS